MKNEYTISYTYKTKYDYQSNIPYHITCYFNCLGYVAISRRLYMHCVEFVKLKKNR